MTELHHLGVAELAALLQSKQVSAVEVATRFLARLGGNPHHALAANCGPEANNGRQRAGGTGHTV